MLAACGLAAVGCADAPPTPGGGGGFVSDSPFGNNNNGDGSGEDAGGTGSGTGGGSAGEDGGAEKAIAEADVIQVDGNHLYALSQYGGLSVVDMSNPAALSIVGRYRVQGVPFEMYLKDDIVYAMFSSFGQWQCDAGYGSCEYITSSHIEALDVSDPAHIAKIGSFDLPGEISDSRIVGEVLYAVSYENGYCWNCGSTPSTSVTSIHIGDPADIATVDQVSFTSPNVDDYGWTRRSVSVTPDRMFVAGIEWNGQDDGHSTIQVVDISDPGGQLHVGAVVNAAGMIESRWQMDEKDGVLRVISQPGIWTNGVPTVQTFQINSSDSIVAMAALDLVLPKPERLRSARFDGNRLFAITAEQTDPLFTIDLTNPAAPAQLGELEMPGWIYHLEPRGDRLFALGFDPENPDGSMNVSLFDVSNMATPTLLERVAFGGDWSWAPEDQDRIHKAFKIDADLGAIFVPYGAYSYDEDAGYYGCGQVDSGVQIIDFGPDSLTRRGSAPLHGFARRALVHNGKLFTVSDAEVAAYDIANRDAPARVDTVPLSSWVNQTVRAGNNVVRISSEWWTNAAQLDVVPANAPDRAEALGTLDLTELVGDEDDAGCYGWGYFYGAKLFAIDAQHVALAWSTYDWYGYDYDSSGSPESKTHVVVVNIANTAAPVVEGRVSMPFAVDMYGWWGSLDGGAAIVQMGNRLVLRRITHPAWDSNDLEKAWLEVVDLSNPAAPVNSASVELPDGFGHSLLVKNGSQILTSHWEPVPGMPGKVKFFLDRVFVPQVGAPVAHTPVNVPGALLSFDAATSHLLTIDFHHVNVPGLSAEECYQQYGYGYVWYDESNGPGVCSFMQQTLKLAHIDGDDDVTLLDSELLDADFYIYGTRVTETRVFAQGYNYNNDTGFGQYSVFVIGDIGANQIQSAQMELPVQDSLYAAAATGDRLVLASYGTPGIHVLDASDLSDITIEKKGDVNGYVYDVTLDGDRALCAMGPYGLDVVELQ